MLETLVDIVKRIPKITEAMGINLGVEEDGKTVTLDIAGNKVNAVVDGGKLTKVSVDFDKDPKKTLDTITKAITGEETLNEIKTLENYPSSADVNPEVMYGAATYGENNLFGGYTTVVTTITDHDKYIEFQKNIDRWTQYEEEAKLFDVVRKILGFDNKKKKNQLNLTELFTGAYDPKWTSTLLGVHIDGNKTPGKVEVNIATEWCIIHIVNYYPEEVNKTSLASHQKVGYNWVDVYNGMMNDGVPRHGLVIGSNPGMLKTIIEEQLARIDAPKFVSVDVREDGPMRTISASLCLADTVARVAYATQLAQLSNLFNLVTIPALPASETETREYYEKYIKDLDYDSREKLLKLEMVNWE